MEREFVSYTEALALKELGFDDPCFGYYYLYKDENYQEGKFDYRGELNIEYSIYKENTYYILAPTYSQAFRWFRKKGQDSTILPTSQFYTPLVYNEIPSGKKKELYITYEDAELECLKKLIQFVKEK